MSEAEDRRRDRHQVPVRIISCSVFRSAIERLKLKQRFPDIAITFLPSSLHNRPEEIKEHLNTELEKARASGERAVCLYGECFKDIDLFCHEHGASRVRGHHCYELLLGAGTFGRIMEENARTYFLEGELVINFEEYCLKPLELEDAEMRELMFKNYERLIYVRQPGDPNLMGEIEKIAGLLGLELEVKDAEYEAFEAAILEMINERDEGG